MIIENLSQLYPKGYLSKTIGSEATYSIPVDDQFFIEIGRASCRERV